MRNRRLAAVTVLGLLAVASGYAVADQPDRPAGEPPGAQPSAVVLPTGDRVRISGAGLDFEPAAGRAGVGYYSPRGQRTDRVVIPRDAIDDVHAGTVDDRLFNVDALLRNGITDARTVSAPARLGEPVWGRHTGSDAAATAVTVRHTWLDGSVPPWAQGVWVNLDTGANDGFSTTNGIAELSLAPGRYSLLSELSDQPENAPWTIVGAVTDFTVGETPAQLAVDGTLAKPLRVSVDRDDAVPGAKEVQFFVEKPDGTNGFTGLYGLDADDRVYAIPSPPPDGHDAGLSVRSELTSPPGAAQPYSYTLFNQTERGIPADPTFAVHDADLAVRHATYHGLGGKPVQLTRRDLPFHRDRIPFGYLPGSPVMLPATRTEYYTAGPDVVWSHLGVLESGSAGGPADHAMHDSGAMTVGERDEEWFSAPLSVRVPDALFPYYKPGMWRWPSPQPALMAEMPMFSSGAAAEVINSSVPGMSVISKDGVELARSEQGGYVVAELKPDDAGRYTVTMAATRDVPWTPLGTRSSATWTVDSVPVSAETPLSVSAVRFDSPAVVDGYAERGTPQPVELEYETQPGAVDRQCRGMTFEVSYDDGVTWSTVDIARDGDHATATLNHPDGAEFVSVRFTAVDESGQTVETTTIRSFGLR